MAFTQYKYRLLCLIFGPYQAHSYLKISEQYFCLQCSAIQTSGAASKQDHKLHYPEATGTKISCVMVGEGGGNAKKVELKIHSLHLFEISSWNLGLGLFEDKFSLKIVGTLGKLKNKTY